MDSGQIPTPDSPPNASPLSLRRTRRYLGLACSVIDRQVVTTGCRQVKPKAEGGEGSVGVLECWSGAAGLSHHSIASSLHFPIPYGAAAVSPTWKRMNRRMLISSFSCRATPATCSLTVISEFFLTKQIGRASCRER